MLNTESWWFKLLPRWLAKILKWINEQTRIAKEKKEILLEAIDLFRKKIELTGKNHEIVVNYFSKMKSIIPAYFPNLQSLLDAADKEFNCYCYYLNRKINWNTTGEFETGKMQEHVGYLMDITSDMESVLSNKKDRRKFEFNR